ncbi:GNAT family N-acetyltransferase [Actinoplanes sp. LDG1-06]|uniref:GNAT family N-acetyltransferase n=2 Tax=Paractinoplanes ovalisporus TaxID=2810368 RepID=A0ABS2AHU6_9ACTN|nr:GNAT family N-acetyltransferase [Actinoplanes ovalisporus]
MGLHQIRYDVDLTPYDWAWNIVAVASSVAPARRHQTVSFPVHDCDTTVLDDPVGLSLRGPHRHLARWVGQAVTYEAEVASFASVPLDPSAADWNDLARLLGTGQLADLFSAPVTPPRNWTPVFALDGVQMISDGRETTSTTTVEVAQLGHADVPDMLALTAETRPGPFWPRTVELGAFYGVRDSGSLVAMAGERLRPSGWTEISSVCTAGTHRGRGLAAQVVHAAANRITACGKRPFLHVAANNHDAIRLYERLGFTVRRQVRFHGYQVP